MILPRRRPFGLIVAAFVFSTLVLGLLVSTYRFSIDSFQNPWATDIGLLKPVEKKPKNRKVHLLLPATQTNVHLCKTLLTLSLLNYPKPHIVAWGDTDADTNLLGGGSHFGKITRVLDYINDEERRQQPGFEDELVLMIDSYDIWFQLPLETLLHRYHAVVEEENLRVAQRMGRAYAAEDISSPIIFGGGKRCSPNHIQTVACYPTPESPLPKDLFGPNTDTLLGRNAFSNFRTRYLNSGYMIGPVGKMRPLLERARQKLDECIGRTGIWYDNDYGAADFCYRGSDQSIFVEMFGEQEFHREVMRRHHRRLYDDILDKIVSNRPGAKPPRTSIMTTIIDDPLNPAFTHQEMDQRYVSGKPFEFGIAIDYWSLLGHQTSNAEYDGRFIRQNQPLQPQIGRQGIFDCLAKVPRLTDLPGNGTGVLPAGMTWDSIPLYTEICLGTVPVMIHHNSVDKKRRERQWDLPWWNGTSRQLLELRRTQKQPMLVEGISSDKGTTLLWEELCPPEAEAELFRDINPQPEKDVTKQKPKGEKSAKHSV